MKQLSIQIIIEIPFLSKISIKFLFYKCQRVEIGGFTKVRIHGD